LSHEYVLSAQPEVIIISTMERGQNLEKILRFWHEFPGLGDRPDVRITSIQSDVIDRPGPRLGSGLEDLARLVHPKRFPQKENDN
jgi:iron complex transport system substrate-binding protein